MLEANKAIIRRYRQEVANEGQLDVVDELFAESFSMNGQEMTPESFKPFVEMWRVAFPDLVYAQEDLVAEDDRVVERWTCQGTHQGTLFGIPPTGKHITGTGILIHRIVDGKIVAFVEVADGLGLMQQLGVLPPME